MTALTKKNDFIWKAIQTVCWIIFVGYCIQTGTLVFNLVFSLFQPIATHNLHMGLDLSDLHNKSLSIYFNVMLTAILISGVKSYLFYVVIKTFKALNLVKPFSTTIGSIMSKITRLMFSIGLISLIAQASLHKLNIKGYDTGLAERYLSDGGTYLMVSAIFFVVALIFQKGIELQSENDLTV